ncbi:portal protein [Achromobacter phage vB_AxyP_19-32_Axy12]|uniref:Putative portal protein n=1 Tax=Achromobacter phage vB_AxyP_19-32_Axy12 TaxID=2591043 RepID=A0A514CUC7_9CAUD|nr:portal protein [Achromobacter phage vB_AxyP_19-32_Axy12]QDH84082.1 putative portal protein [Achromobacter phage vB_AxyP_19-32_Axy12]
MEHQNTGLPLPDPAQSAKLTDWPNEPSLQALKMDHEAAKPEHDAQISKIQNWNDQMQVKGKARPPVVKGRSQVQPKLVRRQAEWRYSALTEPFLGSDKLYKVTPVTFEDEDAAVQNELVLNWQFRTKFNRVKLIDDFVRATVDEGTSVLRLGWKRVTKKVKQMAPVYSFFPIQEQEQFDQLQQAIEAENANPRGFDEQASEELKQAVAYYKESGEATFAIQTGEQEIEVEQVLENRPTIEVMNPANVTIDPSCQGDIEKAMFAIVSFETSQHELQKEGRYKNLDKVVWNDASPLTEPDHETKTPQDFQFRDATRKRVVAYEYWGYWDIYGNGEMHPIVATWIGSVLIRMELNPFPDGKLPFVLVPYMPVKRELYGEPDAELLEDNQKILGAVTRGMIDLLGRSANGQQGFAKGMLDALNRKRYDDGKDYEYNPTLNPNQGLIEHKFPELPQSAIVMLNLQNQEAEALTGVKSFAGGVSGEAYGDVAAGIRGVLDASSKREMAILRRLAKGMTEVGMKIIAMNAVFMSEEEVIRVTNSEYVTVKREDLAGNFDLEVDIATAEVDNQKAQDLSFMLQTLGNTMDFGITKMILSEIAKLKRMPVLAHAIKTFEPQPDPVAEEMRQLELEKLRAEVMEIRSKAQKNAAEAGLKGAQTDKTNLDYLEQETGTTHARNMQAQQAQAEGNQDLQVTKALLAPKKEGEGSPNIPAAVAYNALTKQSSAPLSTIERDQAAQGSTPANLGSSSYDPSQDPAMNPAIRLTN